MQPAQAAYSGCRLLLRRRRRRLRGRAAIAELLVLLGLLSNSLLFLPLLLLLALSGTLAVGFCNDAVLPAFFLVGVCIPDGWLDVNVIKLRRGGAWRRRCRSHLRLAGWCARACPQNTDPDVLNSATFCISERQMTDDCGTAATIGGWTIQAPFSFHSIKTSVR